VAFCLHTLHTFGERRSQKAVDSRAWPPQLAQRGMSLQPFTFFEAHMNSTIGRWIRRAIALLLVVGLQGTPALAQGDARFRGTVRDASGAVVRRATASSAT